MRKRSSKPFAWWFPRRRSANVATALAAETVLYASLFLAGVFGLSLVIALSVVPRQPSLSRYVPVESLPIPPGFRQTPAHESHLAAWIFGALSVGVIAIALRQLMTRFGRIVTSDELRGSWTTRLRSIYRGLRRIADDDRRPGDREDLGHLPAVPPTDMLIDSPGERLTYRLPAEPTDDRFIGTALLALAWNGSWFVLLAIAVDGFVQQQPRPVMAILLVPLGWIGWGLFRRMIDAVRGRAGLGPTVVEISDHPLQPGGDYVIDVTQHGRLRLRTLTVELVCEEEAIFRQGTDVRTECHVAFSRMLDESTSVRVDPHRPWRQQCGVTLDSDVMHSLAGEHNAIRWRIQIRGKSRQWPSFCRRYPVVVHPPLEPSKTNPR